MKNWNINREDIKYAFCIFRHPVDEFWEMKRLKKGNLLLTIIITVLCFLSIIFNRQALGFMFNNNHNVPLDLMKQIRIFILPLALFCVANWSITTLMDGKGTLCDIFMVVGYSMQVLIVFNIITPLLSRILSLNEKTYLTIIYVCGIVWFGLMVFAGIQQIHEYSFGKTVATVFLTIIAALIIVFICLLFFSLLQEIAGFFYSIYLELTLRLYS